MKREHLISHNPEIVMNEKVLAKTKLAQSVVQLAQSMYKAEQEGMVAGLISAGETIVNAVPMLDEIFDGKLVPSSERKSNVSTELQEAIRSLKRNIMV